MMLRMMGDDWMICALDSNPENTIPKMIGKNEKKSRFFSIDLPNLDLSLPFFRLLIQITLKSWEFYSTLKFSRDSLECFIPGEI